MQRFTVICFIAAVVCVVNLMPLITLEEERVFKEWVDKFDRVYSPEEYPKRLQIFTENKRRIDEHNAGNHSYKQGLNQFADMTFDEFRSSGYIMRLPQEGKPKREQEVLTEEPNLKENCSATRGNHVSSYGLNPDSVDWRKRGNFVSPVKDQGHCGSCWTFATTGCLESVTAIATGKLLLLAEQQLIDCAQDFNNHGCNGGLPSQAFEYIKYNYGLMTEEDYPYKGLDGICYFKPELAAAFVKDVVNITSYDEKGMVDAVARLNPVSFGYEVTDDFVHYKEGVYTSDQCKNSTETVNHAVLAIGYGVEKNGIPYWIVKNSWGTDWGMDGYFWIERGKNMCGLAACSSYPLV